MTVTLGKRIDQLHQLREKKRSLEKQAVAISNEMSELEGELIAEMDAQGVVKSTGAKAGVTITSSTKPSVDDWDAFYAYIHKNKYYHLLDRRPSVNGCRELLETKGKIPGIVPFTKRTLYLKSN